MGGYIKNKRKSNLERLNVKLEALEVSNKDILEVFGSLKDKLYRDLRNNPKLQAYLRRN